MQAEYAATPTGAPSAQSADTSRPRLRNRVLVALLVVLYIVFWGVTALYPVAPSDLDAFFIPSAQLVAFGHPLLAYSIRYDLIYPNANGPLSLLPLAAVLRLASALGWLQNDTMRRVLILGAFSVFTLLVTREGLLTLRWLHPRPFTKGFRIISIGLLAFSPLLWHSVLFYGHIEQPILIWLALWSVRLVGTGRILRGGIVLGLAFLTRSTALFVLIPLAVILLSQRRWWQTILLGGTTALVTALGVLPFYLRDPADTTYSLLTFHRELIVAAGNIWGFFFGTPLIDFAANYDTEAVVAASLLVCGAAVLARSRFAGGNGFDLRSPQTYALLALTNLCFTLLVKTLWPYYFLETYMYAGVWALASIRASGLPVRRREWLRLFVPLWLFPCAQLAEHAVLATHNGIVRFTLSLHTCLALLVVILPLMWALYVSRSHQEQQSQAATAQAIEPLTRDTSDVADAPDSPEAAGTAGAIY